MNALIEQGLAEQEGGSEEPWILAAGWPYALVRAGIPADQGETECMQKGCPSVRGTPSDQLVR